MRRRHRILCGDVALESVGKIQFTHVLQVYKRAGFYQLMVDSLVRTADIIAEAGFHGGLGTGEGLV